MSLTGKEITALDASFQVGSMVDVAEVEDEKYGADPGTTAIAIAKRKAKTGDTLPELLSRSDGAGIKELMTVLIRDHNLLGLSRQVAVLTSWKTETEDVYGEDIKGYVEYVKRYRKKYRGRAFPVPIDYALVIKGLKTSDTSALRDQVVKLVKEMADSQRQVKEAMSTIAALKSQVGNLKNPSTRGDRAVPPTFKCKTCGAVGEHWTDKCPKRNEDKEEEKDA